MDTKSFPIVSQKLRYTTLGKLVVDVVVDLEVELAVELAVAPALSVVSIATVVEVEYRVSLAGGLACTAETARQGFKNLFSTPIQVAPPAPLQPRHGAISLWIRSPVLP